MAVGNGGMIMSIMPMKHRCPICKKYFQWNPDVGRMFCPKCMRDSNGMEVDGIIKAMEKIRGNKL